jgi:hypothetical protein
MTIEKVRRYHRDCSNGDHSMRESDAGLYIEYADVAGLVEALSSLIDACPSDYVDHSAISNARNELARWQS